MLPALLFGGGTFFFVFCVYMDAPILDSLYACFIN